MEAAAAVKAQETIVHTHTHTHTRARARAHRSGQTKHILKRDIGRTPAPDLEAAGDDAIRARKVRRIDEWFVRVPLRQLLK